MIYELIEDEIIAKLEKGVEVPKTIVISTTLFDQMINEMLRANMSFFEEFLNGIVKMNIDGVEVQVLRDKGSSGVVH